MASPYTNAFRKPVRSSLASVGRRSTVLVTGGQLGKFPKNKTKVTNLRGNPSPGKIKDSGMVPPDGLVFINGDDASLPAPGTPLVVSLKLNDRGKVNAPLVAGAKPDDDTVPCLPATQADMEAILEGSEQGVFAATLTRSRDRSGRSHRGPTVFLVPASRDPDAKVHTRTATTTYSGLWMQGDRRALVSPPIKTYNTYPINAFSDDLFRFERMGQKPYAKGCVTVPGEIEYADGGCSRIVCTTVELMSWDALGIVFKVHFESIAASKSAPEELGLLCARFLEDILCPLDEKAHLLSSGKGVYANVDAIVLETIFDPDQAPAIDIGAPSEASPMSGADDGPLHAGEKRKREDGDEDDGQRAAKRRTELDTLETPLLGTLCGRVKAKPNQALAPLIAGLQSTKSGLILPLSVVREMGFQDSPYRSASPASPQAETLVALGYKMADEDPALVCPLPENPGLAALFLFVSPDSGFGLVRDDPDLHADYAKAVDYLVDPTSESKTALADLLFRPSVSALVYLFDTQSLRDIGGVADAWGAAVAAVAADEE